MEDNQYLLEVLGVSKFFPGVQALKDVSFKIKKGEVHALLGENGAGKSTLMKILMGLYKADEGKVLFNGEKISINNPSQAMDLGISMIHQELNPVPHMTIAENIFLHREQVYKGTPFINQKELNRQTSEILARYNIKLNPKSLMSTLTVAQMQMIEIIKAITFNSKLVIMDEPTSSLESYEVKSLFKTIGELKAKGIAIIYISHRLEEIFEIADAVTVLCDGRYIGIESISNVTTESLVTMMVGRKLENLFPKYDVEIGEKIFEVKNFNKKGVFENVDFCVRRGEILGFAGLVGAGRSEIMRAIFGLDPKDSGEVYYEGKKLKIKSPRDAIKQGLTMVTEDRKEYGLILCRSIKENISLPNLREHQRKLFISHKKEKEEAKQVSDQLMVTAANLDVETLSLSGGNQQKVIIAKWILASPKVMIMDEPTRGIDVGAKAEIHKLISKLVSKGMSVILISSELPEVMSMSDRILVVHEGRINGEFHRKDILDGKVNQEHILKMALGGK